MEEDDDTDDDDDSEDDDDDDDGDDEDDDYVDLDGSQHSNSWFSFGNYLFINLQIS